MGDIPAPVQERDILSEISLNDIIFYDKRNAVFLSNGLFGRFLPESELDRDLIYVYYGVRARRARQSHKKKEDGKRHRYHE